MSETSNTRKITEQYCQGNGVDLGSGGDPVVPWAIQFDQNRVAHLSAFPVQWVGDVFSPLPFKDDTLDFVFASHVIEDVSEWYPILKDWTRVLKKGGYIVIQVPDRVRFRAAVTGGQEDNLAHKHESYVGELTAMFTHYYNPFGLFRIVMDQFEPSDSYNILFVATKLWSTQL